MKCIVLILTIISTTCWGQNDEVAVKNVVNRLFAGMQQADTTLIRSAFSRTAILQTVIKNQEGKVIIVSEPLDSFMLTISKPHTQAYNERITFDAVKIDGELAMAWAPYRFYLGETFSHCGVDAFQLVKIDGEWKIQYLIDTRRRQGCE
jgi:hypothetical protein